ncbi:MAG: MATE family efflux transporter [Tissierellia bacterium]|nr:MATE family efflux transporter [Tissierellia bacterium]
MTDISQSRSKLLGEKPIPELLFKFSMPAIVGMVINALYNIVDRIFLGAGVNQLAIGGVFLTFPIQMIILGFGMIIGIGGNSLASIRFGQGKKEESEKILGNAFTLCVSISLILTLIFGLNLNRLLIMFGASDTILPYARDYGQIVIYGTIFNITGFALNNFIRGEGNPSIAMKTMMIGAVTNIILDYIFIFKLNFGTKGAALATVIGQLFSAIWVLTYFLGKKSMLKLKKSTLNLSTKIIKEIFSLGITPFSMQVASSIVNIALNNLLQSYGGDVATSSMSVIYSIFTLGFLPVVGLTQGLQPILGFNYGAKKMKRVQTALKLAMISAVVYTSICWLIAMIFPEVLIKIFVSRPDDFAIIKDIAIPGLRIYALCLPIIGYSIVAGNHFLALGQPKIGFILTMSRQMIFLLPVLILLPKIFGLTGIWMSFPVSDFLATLLTTYFLLKSGILTKDQKDLEMV